MVSLLLIVYRLVTAWAITYQGTALILLSNYRYFVVHIMSYEPLPPLPPAYINWLFLPIERIYCIAYLPNSNYIKHN
jgi:hypothetical protein